jgi:hypothetical protein
VSDLWVLSVCCVVCVRWVTSGYSLYCCVVCVRWVTSGYWSSCTSLWNGKIITHKRIYGYCRGSVIVLYSILFSWHAFAETETGARILIHAVWLKSTISGNIMPFAMHHMMWHPPKMVLQSVLMVNTHILLISLKSCRLLQTMSTVAVYALSRDLPVCRQRDKRVARRVTWRREVGIRRTANLRQ